MNEPCAHSSALCMCLAFREISIEIKVILVCIDPSASRCVSPQTTKLLAQDRDSSKL